MTRALLHTLREDSRLPGAHRFRTARHGSPQQILPPAAEIRRAAALRAALRRFLRRSELSARAAGLTPRQHLLLLMIAGSLDLSGKASVSELSERLQLAQSTVTELVDRAVGCGLVRREHSPRDARVSLIRLTEEGEERLARVFSSLAQERAELLQAIENSR
jgi:DNA-binding MarR family transcriptional regulator